MKCWPSFSSQSHAFSQSRNVRFDDISWEALDLNLEVAKAAVDNVPVPGLPQAVRVLAALFVAVDVRIFFFSTCPMLSARHQPYLAYESRSRHRAAYERLFRTTLNENGGLQRLVLHYVTRIEARYRNPS
jgi:hypothetical protein